MNKSTVCFITPPSPFLLDQRVFPALGVLKVAAVAERLGYPVEHLDLNGVDNYESVVQDYCGRNNTYLFAVTATTPQMVSAKKIRQTLLRSVPNARTIIGGPHPTLVVAAYRGGAERAKKAMERLVEDWDVVVAGDGEKAIEHALKNDVVVGVLDADDPKGQWFMRQSELEDYPLPARHLIDIYSYHYQIDGVAVTPLIAQLGCPFGCNFCAGRDSGMLRRVRLRSTESVLAEMEHIAVVHGFYGFMMFDDELNVNPNFVELLQGMRRLQDRLGVEFRCRGFVKAELFTEEQGREMHAAGFRRVMCGFESGSEKILKNINKRATKGHNTNAMEISHKFGLEMKALMSVGHPGESQETINDTAQWLLDVKPSDFDVTIITPYPGSPYYDRASLFWKNDTTEAKGDTWVFETNGDRLYMRDIEYTEVEDFYKGSLDGYKSYVWTDKISAEGLVTLRNAVEKSVRGKLGIPFYQAGEGRRFEASMGALPGWMYRRGRGN